MYVRFPFFRGGPVGGERLFRVDKDAREGRGWRKKENKRDNEKE